MKSKRNVFIIVIAIGLIALSILTVIGNIYGGNAFIESFVSIVTVYTAIIGAVALFYQFKRDKDLNEASFLVSYSEQFYAVYELENIMNELEKCRVNPEYKIDIEQHYTKIVGYLEWLETLSSLINSEVLQIERIDNVMSYRYFLIVNNKQIQDCELIPNRDFYRGIFEIYPLWSSYKKRKNLPIPLEENALNKAID